MKEKLRIGSKRIIANLLVMLKDKGYDLGEICEGSKILFDKFLSGEMEMTNIDAECIWDAAVKTTNDPILGFKLGLNMDLSALSNYGMILQKSPNMLELFQNAARYIFLLTDIIDLEVENRRNEIVISVIPQKDAFFLYVSRLEQSALMVLGLILNLYQVLSFKKPKVLKAILPATVVDFPYFESVLNHKVIISNKPMRYCLVLDNSDLLTPLLDSDVELLQLLIENASRQASPTENIWTSKVHAELYNSKDFILTLSEVANNLHVSSRSIQRKLRDERTSFKEISEDVKCDLAKYYLYSNLNLKSIVFKLNFSNAATFNRAFISWTGVSVQNFLNKKKHLITPIV